MQSQAQKMNIEYHPSHLESTVIEVPHIVHSRCSPTCSASLGKQKNALQDMPHYDTMIYNMSPYDTL